MGLPTLVREFFGASSVAIGILIAFGLVYRAVFKTLSTKAGLDRLERLAKPNISWIDQYRVLLKVALDRIENFLSPSTTQCQNIWSRFDAESFEKFFIFALTYPVLSTVYNYFKFDAGSYLGPIFFFPGTSSLTQRTIIFLVFVGSPILSIQTVLDFYRRGIEPRVHAFTALNLIIVFLGAMTILFPYEVPYTLGEALLGSVCISCVYVGALIYIGTGKCSELLVISAIAACLFGFGLYGLATFPVIISVYAAHLHLKARGKLGYSISFILISNLVMTNVLIYIFPVSKPSAAEIVIVIFAVILSSVNGFFDWLSVSVTRILLRLNLSAPPVRILCYTLLDFGFAIVIVLSLIFFSGLLISISNQISLAGGGVCLLDLNAFIEQISVSPENYRWLYMTLYSTFIPSLLHMYLMGLALGLILIAAFLKIFEVTHADIRNVYIIRVLVAGEYSVSIFLLFAITIVAPFWVLIGILEHENALRDNIISLLKLGIRLSGNSC